MVLENRRWKMLVVSRRSLRSDDGTWASARQTNPISLEDEGTCEEKGGGRSRTDGDVVDGHAIPPEPQKGS